MNFSTLILGSILLMFASVLQIVNADISLFGIPVSIDLGQLLSIFGHNIPAGTVPASTAPPNIIHSTEKYIHESQDNSWARTAAILGRRVSNFHTPEPQNGHVFTSIVTTTPHGSGNGKTVNKTFGKSPIHANHRPFLPIPGNHNKSHSETPKLNSSTTYPGIIHKVTQLNQNGHHFIFNDLTTHFPPTSLSTRRQQTLSHSTFDPRKPNPNPNPIPDTDPNPDFNGNKNQILSPIDSMFGLPLNINLVWPALTAGNSNAERCISASCCNIDKICMIFFCCDPYGHAKHD